MIKVKITWEQLALLHDAHFEKEITEPGDHGDLLRELRDDLCRYFNKYLNRGHKTYRLSFTRAQALTIMQLWMGKRLPPDAAHVIQNLIGVIDQVKHQSKIISVL